MAKITRYTGNFKAFGSASQGTERTVFGDVVQSDALDSNINANFMRGWGVVPVNGTPTKQDFNALGFTLSQVLAYLHQQGVAAWDAAQEYNLDAITTRNGKAYISQANANIGNDPALSPLSWKPYLTDAEVSALIAAQPSPLGIGQTWQNVTASRAATVTYTNTLARTIKVQVWATINIQSGGGAGAYFTIDGNTLVGGGIIPASTAPNNTSVSAEAIIPPNSTYSLTLVGAVISNWMELK